MNENIKTITPLQFYCQKVLPLVYDESLSYYEVLCKIQLKLNEVIKAQNELQEQFLKLQEWITNEIELLVNGTLDEWLADGTLENLINDRILGNLKSQIDAISERVLKLENKKDYYLIIGDSYSVGSGVGRENSWSTVLKRLLKATDNYYVYDLGGASFSSYGTSNPSFSQLIQNAINELSSETKTLITHVIIGGGANDWNADSTLILNGISNCCLLIDQNFPNATKHICFMGWDIRAENRKKLMDTYYTYSNGCGAYGFSMMNEVFSVLQNRHRLQEDGTHPTNTGQADIASYIFNLLNGGNSKTTPLLNPLTLNGSNIGNIINNGLTLELHFKSATLSIQPVTIGFEWVKIGNMTDSYNLFGCADFKDFSFYGDAVITTNNVLKNVRLLFSIKQDDLNTVGLYAQSLSIENESFITFPNVTKISIIDNIVMNIIHLS